MMQPEPLRLIALAAKEKGMNVWCYTGFTLEKLLETLPPEFRRVHRSFVVNADNIQRVVLSQNLVYLRGDVAVPLSRSYKKEVREYDA